MIKNQYEQEITLGNENIFEDLGFDKEEATKLKICADLMLNYND